jgi:hypothetical protein
MTANQIPFSEIGQFYMCHRRLPVNVFSIKLASLGPLKSVTWMILALLTDFIDAGRSYAIKFDEIIYINDCIYAIIIDFFLSAFKKSKISLLERLSVCEDKKISFHKQRKEEEK